MRKRKYTGFNFFVDVLLTICTSGIWFIWIIIRESRNGLG